MKNKVWENPAIIALNAKNTMEDFGNNNDVQESGLIGGIIGGIGGIIGGIIGGDGCEPTQS